VITLPGKQNSNSVDTPDQTPGHHCHRTPYGRLKAQLQPNGLWVVGTQLTVPAEMAAEVSRLLDNLSTAVGAINDASLPRLAAVRPAELSSIWKIGRQVGLVPASTLGSPLPEPVVRNIVDGVARALRNLHEQELAACDIAPSVIFCGTDGADVCLVPSPWLGRLVCMSPGDKWLIPFVAPEIVEVSPAIPDLVRADVFSLGELAWYLLTGTDRRDHAGLLVSNLVPAMQSWDVFVDGCCRSNPARRFSSVDEALAGLSPVDERNDVSQLPEPAPSDMNAVRPIHIKRVRRSGKRRFVLAVFAVLALIAGIAAYLRREWIGEHVPFAGRFVLPYKRGYGDTVVQYADRSYAGSSWKKLADISAIQSVANGNLTLEAVSGWDSDSFWIIGRGAQFGVKWDVASIRYDGGTWKTTRVGVKTNSPGSRVRLIDRQTALVAVGDGGSLLKIAPDGATELATGIGLRNWSCDICPISTDLFYYFGTWSDQVLRVAGDQVSKMDEKQKESYIHRSDNVPLRGCPVYAIQHTRTYREGRAVGIYANLGEDHPLLVEFRDGIWYSIAKVPHPNTVTERQASDLWALTDGENLSCVITVNDGGEVTRYPIGGTPVRQTVSDPQAYTSTTLINVWGVSTAKYWTMDDSGTVWEWSDGTWKVVVRGLNRDGVRFTQAWVSPTGVIIAITNSDVYRLE
jgi:hypothetical protein